MEKEEVKGEIKASLFFDMETPGAFSCELTITNATNLHIAVTLENLRDTLITNMGEEDAEQMITEVRAHNVAKCAYDFIKIEPITPQGDC